MNKTQRDKFFKRIETKYCLAQIIDPWKNKPSVKRPEWRIINQLDILQAIKNVHGVMLIPSTYHAEIPKEQTIHPWGPTITFIYGTSPVPENLREIGDQNIMNQVESQLNTRLNAYIHVIGTEYLGENNIRQSLYKVTITQKS